MDLILVVIETSLALPLQVRRSDRDEGAIRRERAWIWRRYYLPAHGDRLSCAM